MIELPKRSITRFFVPLIDVLILLFCIFLLMPYVATPESTNGQPPEQGALSKDDADKLREKLKSTEEKVQEFCKRKSPGRRSVFIGATSRSTPTTARSRPSWTANAAR